MWGPVVCISSDFQEVTAMSEDWWITSIDRVEGAANDLHEALEWVMDALREAEQPRGWALHRAPSERWYAACVPLRGWRRVSVGQRLLT
jgi:hypothetical protein